MKLLIMIYLLVRNEENVLVSELRNKYYHFYNDNISNVEIQIKLDLLIDNNYVMITQNQAELTELGVKEAHLKNIDFYFNEAIKISDKIEPEKKYQKSKNNLNIKSDSIIDRQQIGYVVENLLDLEATIVDLGCGRGSVINYISEKLNNDFIGIDKSLEMISIASNQYKNIKWLNQNIEEYNLDTNKISAFILIDSIYFIKDIRSLIDKLHKDLHPGGMIIIAYSEYIKDISDSSKLKPENTRIGKSLDGLNYKYQDYTDNEVFLWELRIKLLNDLRNDYIKLNQEYFYYDKIVEAKELLNTLKKGLARRYIYIIKKNKKNV